MKTKDKVLFNEKCRICNLEIQHYKKRSNINFVDCSDMEDKYLKKLHVCLSDGKELVGLDAFIYVWRRTKGYNLVAVIASLPVIKQIAKFIYLILAFLIYWRFKIFIKR
tara:strand:- start:773 stop:1099 length:327 start_codon:yes stop_codon:yes gene_type:complete